MQNEEKLNRLEVKKTLIYTWKIERGTQNQIWASYVARVGGMALYSKPSVPQQVCAASLAAMEMTSPEIFTSVQVKAWSSRLNFWVKRNQGEQFPYLFEGTIRLRNVMNHGKTQIRIRMHTAHFSGF